MDRVLFIDAHNAIWRACVTFGHVEHGMDAPYGADGNNDLARCKCGSPWDIGGCYGERYVFVFNFFRNLRPLIEDCAPDKCFFVLEGHPQFRYDLYSGYKANRIIKQASTKKEDHAKFLYTKEVILQLMKHLPITTCRADKYEADDVIATLCANLHDEDLTVISNDSDYIQLLQAGYPHISIYNPIKKVCMEAPPYPYVAWKCLNGDKSDNIQALLKPKKALETVNDPKLFAQFLDQEENRANFRINQSLIEFRMVPEEELIMEEGVRNFELLKQAFIAMRFESIINEKSWTKFTKTFDCIKY